MLLAMKVTPELISSTIEEDMEPSEPVDTIMEILRANNGKRADQRLMKKIHDATGNPKIALEKEFGMTHINWSELHNGKPTFTHILLIGYKVTNVVVDAEWIYENNPAYFRARDARNQIRRDTLQNRKGEIAALADAINEFVASRQRVLDTLRLKSFEPDAFQIKDIIKARIDKSYLMEM